MERGFIKHIVIIIVVLFLLSTIGFDFIDILEKSGIEKQASGFWAGMIKLLETIFDPIRESLLKLISLIKSLLV